MKPLLSKLSKLMGDEYKNLKGVRKEVASLNEELMTMNAFLEKMEDADDGLDPLAKDWKNRVREMAYDMEDCVDDFMLRVDAGGASVKGGIMEKAARRLRKLRARHQIASKIQELKSRAREVSERRMRYKLDDCIPSSSGSVALDPRLTALGTDSVNLVGLDGPKQELIEWVMDEKQQLKVVFIVGLGGLGKTTLANQVYLQTGRQFKYKAFVSVSQKVDMIGLLSNISEQVEAVHSSRAGSEQDLINKLSEYLQCKRYLIVLDDLWDSLPWDIIRCAFAENTLGSRVIITTRNRSVGIASCCANKYIFDMKPLNHQDSRRLFLTRIFGSEDSSPSNYKGVSNEILKRCGGMPLAIITIASLLAVQKTRLKEEWEYIRNSLSSQFGENPTLEGMKNILTLSYTHLPRHLKPCFLYFGMYPEDRVICTDQLRKQWVAEGFVSNLRGVEAMDVAESYFTDLVNRSLIQPVSIEFNDRVLSCRVHDVMLDLIISKCMEDNFASLVDYSQTSTAGLLKYKARRLSITSSHDEDGTAMHMGVSVASLSQVRSAAFFRGSKHMHSMPRGSMHIPPLSEFKFLRVLLIEVPLYCGLDITDCFTPGDKSTPEFEVSDLLAPKIKVTDLTGIAQLFHLRYLNVVSRFGGYNSVRLPNKIQGLQQLETLETHGILVEGIPTDIVHLPRLSHLRLSFNARLPLPDGIGNMKSLQTLEYFDLMHSSLENIRGLGALTNLRHLALSRDNQRDGRPMAAEAMYALFSSIQKLANLKCLNLTNCTGINDHVVSLLSPYRHMVRHGPGCMLPRVPRWSRDLCNLYSLSIAVDSMCKADLHLIGALPSLAKFNVSIAAPAEDQIVITHSAGFSNLKMFDFMCDVLSCLIFEEGAMPSLRTLSLAFPVAV